MAKGGGSIISTSANLLKWNQALHKDKTVLPKELYNLFITPNLDHYGYGIGIENNDTEVILGHSGGIGSYRTFLLYIPKRDLSIVLLSNICYDFDKIDDELKDAMEKLRDTISDEKELQQKAFGMILQKYPDTRGFEAIMERVGKFVQIPRIFL